jgi:Icc protein
MRARVFAVEDTAVQVCWTEGAPGDVTLEAGPATLALSTHGRPGAAVLDGLPPATSLELVVTDATGRRRRADTFTTLAPPPGRLLSRFATVNDLHIGSHSFGTVHPVWESGVLAPHALRCARAATDEARQWGAERLVVKGDLVQDGRPEEWAAAAELIAGCGLPATVIEGNHDVCIRSIDGTAILAQHGLTLHHQPAAVDLPGVRLVAFPTASWHVDAGHIEANHLALALELVGGAPGAAVVAMHHYPQRFRWPTMYPDGIPGPAASAFLDGLAEANPATMVLTGHSHRHRRHNHGSLVVAEVGSTKDYPGSWAGYAVHEGGIRQVTRRVAAPGAIAWTDAGRRVLGGVWSVWAPGVRSHRCFSHTWPRR